MKGLRWIDRIPTVGLAQFHPQPHLVEKLGMLW